MPKYDMYPIAMGPAEVEYSADDIEKMVHAITGDGFTYLQRLFCEVRVCVSEDTLGGATTPDNVMCAHASGWWQCVSQLLDPREESTTVLGQIMAAHRQIKGVDTESDNNVT